MNVLAGTDETSNVHPVEVAQIFDASQKLLLGRDLLRVLLVRPHVAGGSTRRICQVPGTPLSSCVPRSMKESPDPATRSLTVLETRTSSGPARLMTRAPM